MIEIKNLSKQYKQNKKLITDALVDVNIKFPNNGFICILGKSGSGKSTLLNLLGGLDTPTSGEIIYGNENMVDWQKTKLDLFRNKEIGFVFQDYSLLEHYNILENVTLALDVQNVKHNGDKEASKQLDRVGLAGYEKRFPNELSGGEQQRVAIARALIKGSKIILADEPTGNLDEDTATTILDDLKEISRTKLVIMVTHDEDFASTYADEIVSISNGKIVSVLESKKESFVGDEEKNERENNLASKEKIKLSFGIVKKIAKQSFLKKKVRNLMTIALLTMATIFLTLSLVVNNFDQGESLAKAYDEEGTSKLFVNNDANSIDNEVVSNIKERYPNYDIKKHNYFEVIKKVNSWYNYSIESDVFYNIGINDEFDSSKIEFINNCNNCRMPNKINEIIITDFLAENYFIETYNGQVEEQIIDIRDLINKEVMVSPDLWHIPSMSMKVVITGIKDSKYDYSKHAKLHNEMGYDYFLNEHYRDEAKLYKEKLDNDLVWIYTKEDFFRFNCLNFISRSLKVADNRYFGVEAFAEVNKDELFHNTIFLDNYKNSVSSNVVDVILWDENANKVIKEGDKYFSPTYEDLDVEIENRLNNQNLASYNEKLEAIKGVTGDYLGKKFTLDYNLEGVDSEIVKQLESKSINFRVIGIATNSLSSANVVDTSLYVSTSDHYKIFFEEIKASNISINIGSMNINSNANIINYMLDNNCKIENNILFEETTPFFRFTNLLRNFCIVVAIVFAIAAYITLYITISSNILDSRKEIGILRSLGCSGNDIGKIYILQSAFIFAIILALSQIISLIIVNIINLFMRLDYEVPNSFEFFRYTFVILIIVTVIMGVIMAVTTIKPILKIIKQRPIESIKEL